MSWHHPIKHKTWLALCLLAGSAFAQDGQHVTSKESMHLDVRPFVEAVDTNHDGCMSLKEWKAAGAPMSAYLSLRDARGCVTLEKMETTPPPPGIDANGDGKLTLQEMIAYDKKMTALKRHH